MPAPAQAPQLIHELAVQLLAVGELLTVSVVGIVTVAGWVLDKNKVALPQPLHREVWTCWADRYGRHCETVDRPPVRRRYTREDY
jgi:hypothetical protein